MSQKRLFLMVLFSFGFFTCLVQADYDDSALPYVVHQRNITTTAANSQWGCIPENAANGVGLDATGTTHGTWYQSMWQGGPSGDPLAPNPAGHEGTYWIQFAFDKLYQLTTMWVWNWNAASTGDTRSGMNHVTIEYSTGDPNEWIVLSDDYQFPQAPNSGDPLYAGSDTYIGFAGPDFAGAEAKLVLITVHPFSPLEEESGNWLAPYSDVGVAEVRFYIDPCSVETTTLTMEANPAYVTSITPTPGPHEVMLDSTVPIKADRYVNCPTVQVFDHWEGAGVVDPCAVETGVIITGPTMVTAVYTDGRQCPDECHVPPAGDANIDCEVNLDDFMLLAKNWLSCKAPECD